MVNLYINEYIYYRNDKCYQELQFKIYFQSNFQSMHKLTESKRELFHSKKALYAIHKTGVLSKFDGVFLHAVYSVF